MEREKKDQRKEIVVLDEGIDVNDAGDSVHTAWGCCWVLFSPFR